MQHKPKSEYTCTIMTESYRLTNPACRHQPDCLTLPIWFTLTVNKFMDRCHVLNLLPLAFFQHQLTSTVEVANGQAQVTQVQTIPVEDSISYRPVYHRLVLWVKPQYCILGRFTIQEQCFDEINDQNLEFAHTPTF